MALPRKDIYIIYIEREREREREKNRAHSTTRFARFARQKRKIILLNRTVDEPLLYRLQFVSGA